MEVALFVLTLGASVFAASRLLASSKAERALLDEVWAAAARQLGGQAFCEQATLWRAEARCIEVPLGGATLVVSTLHGPGSSEDRDEFTYVQVVGLEGLCPAELRVVPRGALAKLARGLAIGEVPTGDDRFDAAFRVTSSPAAVARELLDAPTRTLLADLGEGFEIRGRTLTVTRPGLPSEAAPIVALARFGEALARRWAEVARAPARMADVLELGGPGAAGALEGGGATEPRGLRRGRELEVAVLASGPRLVTVVSCAVASGPSFSLERTPEGFKTRGDAPHYASALAADAPEFLRSITGEGKRVSLVLEGLSHDPGDLVRLVDELLGATRTGAIYR